MKQYNKVPSQRKQSMKILYTVLLLSLTFCHTACDDNPSTITPTGQLYLNVTLMNPYNDLESSHAGVTATLFNENTMIQSVQSDEKGDCIFKNVPAGVYGIRIFKNGYAYRHSIPRNDTFFTNNIQFVGSGKYNTGIFCQFQSIQNPDTSFWILNPTLQYEFHGSVNPYKVYVKTNRKPDGNGHTINEDIYNDGTLETKHVKVTVHAVKDFPFKYVKRKVKIYTKFDDNEPTWIEYDMENNKQIVHTVFNRNLIVRDSAGQILTKTMNSKTYSTLEQKKLTVWVECEIVRGKFDNSAKSVSKTTALAVELYD